MVVGNALLLLVWMFSWMAGGWTVCDWKWSIPDNVARSTQTSSVVKTGRWTPVVSWVGFLGLFLNYFFYFYLWTNNANKTNMLIVDIWKFSEETLASKKSPAVSSSVTWESVFVPQKREKENLLRKRLVKAAINDLKLSAMNNYLKLLNQAPFKANRSSWGIIS